LSKQDETGVFSFNILNMSCITIKFRGRIMTKLIYLFIIPIALSSCVTMKSDSMKPLQTVNHVDLNRYVGQWYEIARYEHRFQEGCVGSKASYTLRDDGKISVLNECFEETMSGKLRSAEGKAWVTDKESNAKLKVSFFWPFSGDYWIIDLGENYEYAVVGHPKRKYLWILSRRPQMDEAVYSKIIARLEKQEYDTTKLVRSDQPKD
jgi:apolipoprotein D and lipocalin family protein